MERRTSIIKAKEIMGNNFIGPEEFKSFEKEMGVYISNDFLNIIPSIQFSENLLESLKDKYILILGIPYYKDNSPLTIVKMREHFGWDPDKSEPCFYNQDWYLNEDFAKNDSFKFKWYLLKKYVFEELRGKSLTHSIKKKVIQLPKAVLVTYSFFAFYFHSKKILWENDFIWCVDSDSNGDRIYVGRYNDPRELNKNGFNIHRHLQINKNYTYIASIE